MKRKIFLKVVIVIVIVIVIILPLTYFYSQFQPSQNVVFGLTFSIPYAEYLGFDWKTMFIDIVNDLKPKNMRLMAYWENIEGERGKYDFQEIDEILIEAEKKQIDVILVLGRKQPRWPECHEPAWYKSLSDKQKEQALLIMLENAIKHFRQFQAIKIWQIENEPLFAFGECPRLNRELVADEIKLVKSLDPRPIMLTDSGEQGYWVKTSKLGADVFGSTMYRVVHNPRWGYYKYPLPPIFFKIKAGWLKKFTGIDRVIGVELQAEPWFVEEIYKTDLNQQLALMNPKIFEENIAYAKSVGFSQNYLWGVEWWYWLAKKQNDWGMWEAAKRALSIM